MKLYNLKYLAILPIVSLFSSSCSEEIYESVAYCTPSLNCLSLHVYPCSYGFQSNGIPKAWSQSNGYIHSDNSWAFTDIPSWLEVTPSSGNSSYTNYFNLTAAENDDLTVREAIFFVTASTPDLTISRTITASQEGASPYVEIPDYNYSTGIVATAKNEYQTLDVATNITDLTASFSESWATASYDNTNKKVTIDIQANNGSSRIGYLILSSSSTSTTSKFKLTQYSNTFSCNESGLLNFDAEGGSQTISLYSSDLSWSVQTSSWIEASPESGNPEDKELTINVLPSYEAENRTGLVEIFVGGVSKYGINIVQTGRYIKCSGSNIKLDSDGKTDTGIQIESNIEWTVSSCPSWLTLSPRSGEKGKTTVSFTAEKNNSLNSRTGTVVISDSRSGAVKTEINVSQSGIAIDSNTLEFDWQASQLPLDVSFPNSWTASTSDSWISLSSYSGNGSSSINVSVTRNDSDDTRKGSIIFTSEGNTITYSVLQQGQYLTINSSSGEIRATGGNIKVSVNTSMTTDCKIEYNDDNNTNWITATKTDNSNYSLAVSYNPSINERKATFVIYPTDDEINSIYTQGVKYIVTQKGRKLSASTSEITMYAKGGTSSVYTVNVDGKYSITPADENSWYTVISNTDNCYFKVVCTENTAESSREGKIILSLEDLPTGEEYKIEIAITQLGQNYSISIDDFNEDENWNL